MRALEIPSFGLDHLALVERPSAPVGPLDVRVRVRAISLNYRDWLMITGQYNPRQPLPLVPCSDASGEVVEVGSLVTRVRPGDRVVTVFAPRWLSGEPRRDRIRHTLGGPAPGVLADEIVLHEDGVVRAPAELSFDEAATIPCAGLTAWSALEQCGVTTGQTVLVQGTGGVSIFALQLARARGAEVIVTSRSDDKLARAIALGARHGINYQTTPDWAAGALERTGGEGVHLVVEVGGKGTFAQSIKATRPGGSIAVIGILSGAATEIVLSRVLMSNIRVQGIFVGHRDALEAVIAAVVSAGIRPEISHRFAFEDARAAFSLMREGGHLGKIVVTVQP